MQHQTPLPVSSVRDPKADNLKVLRKINLLVYTTPDYSVTCKQVRCMDWLRELCYPRYVISSITKDSLYHDPWSLTCALLVLPCNQINFDIAGQRLLCTYVESGGVILILNQVNTNFTIPGVQVHFPCNFFLQTRIPGFRIALYACQRGFCIHVNLALPIPKPLVPDNTNEQHLSELQTIHTLAQLIGPYLDKAGINVNHINSDFHAWQTHHSLGNLYSTLSPIYMSSQPFNLISNTFNPKGEQFYISGPVTTFHLQRVTRQNPPIGLSSQFSTNSPSHFTDSSTKIVHLIAYIDALPSQTLTPQFNFKDYFTQLQQIALPRQLLGRTVMYGKVVTSTNTLLYENDNLLQRLPFGCTFTATTQTAGKGRSGNTWNSPPGALMFSVCIRTDVNPYSAIPKTSNVPLNISYTDITFIQYLAAMATVHGIRQSHPALNNLDLRLKWPNDIYARCTETIEPYEDNPELRCDYQKIGGVKVQARAINVSTASPQHYTNTVSQLILIVGIGVNLFNQLPTQSVYNVAKEHCIGSKNQQNVTTDELANVLRHERLLAQILVKFDEYIHEFFQHQGWTGNMEQDYYNLWLHTNQLITIRSQNSEHENGSSKPVRIRGICKTTGRLLAEVVSGADSADCNFVINNKRTPSSLFHNSGLITLGCDSNRFDFFKGLIFHIPQQSV